MKRLLVFLTTWVVAANGLASESDLASTLPKFLDDYCIKCHGPEKQKGERRFDNLSFPIEDSASLIELQDILDLMNLGEMPPEDEETRPETDEALAIIEQLTQTIEARHELYPAPTATRPCVV